MRTTPSISTLNILYKNYAKFRNVQGYLLLNWPEDDAAADVVRALDEACIYIMKLYGAFQEEIEKNKQ